MNELSQLLDDYYKARSIEVGDQRTLAGGVSEMVQAEMAIEEYVNKYAIEHVIRAYRDFQTVAIPETDAYANGWNDCRKRVRADLNYLAEFEEEQRAKLKEEK